MSFKDIKGQERSLAQLNGYLQNDRSASSYLFIGPEGVGKHLAAMTLAKAVNCLEENSDSCDRCFSCSKIEKKAHPDVHTIDAAALKSAGAENDTVVHDSDAIKIEEIRRLQKEINLKPYEARKKVFIINDAHQMTAESSNALLKTLEEPPANSLIILVTAKPNLLFKTVISRCKMVKFYPLERNKLREIMKGEYACDEELAHFLAYFCEGRIGRAIKLKDTDILGTKNRVIDEIVLHHRADPEHGLGLAKQDLRNYLNIMATWFRDIYLLKTGSSFSELINADRKDELTRSARAYSWSALDEILKFIADSLLYLEQNINPKLLLSNLKYTF
jgi:DNA polymerase-3 subunit delta'